MINTLLMVGSLTVFAFVLVFLYIRSKGQTVKIEVDTFNTIDKVLEAVKKEMVELIKDDYSLGLSEEEFNRRYKRQARINDALKNCVYGIDSAKVLVIGLIRKFIDDKVPKEKVTELLGLTNDSEPSYQVKFEILMYVYKKRYGKQALSKWIEEYNLAREREATDAQKKYDVAYYITEEDLDESYRKDNTKLNIEEQIDVLSVLVYQMYKGFGTLDTLREMDINGFNCGTSGSILSAIGKTDKGTFRADKSVWLYLGGKYIHMRFMGFGTEEELRRIIQLLIRYGNPVPLTAKRGFLVNTMYDKSRILALRPPASEYWAVFVRKFTLSDVSPEALLIKPYNHQGELAVQLIEYIVRGQITCGVTGRQGSGKTTLMSSIIRYIDPRFTIRILEMAPELYLRELYPTRNILSLQETPTVSAEELQDALKKSDGAVSIVGEVATNAIAARMIQLGQVASLFTLFSHHANTAKDLVFALRNSLSAAGGFSNMNIAEKQVTDVIKGDIHLDYLATGERYVARVSEIVQLEEATPYPEYDASRPADSMNLITREYYQRSTDRVGFTTHDILRYDVDKHTYYTVDRFSKELEDRLKFNLGKELSIHFDYLMLKEWGPRPEDNMTKEDVKQELERLEALINNMGGTNFTVTNESIDENSKTTYENMCDSDRQREDELSELEAINDFGLGLFYEDSEAGK